MILCTFDEIENYACLNPRFAIAAKWISSTNLQELEHGKTIIDGEEIFAIKETLHGRKADKANLEAHKKYIDVQICLKGKDSIKWKANSECDTILQSYSDENDIMFYADKSVQYIEVYADKAAIFFPEDAHAPLIADEELTKLVIKILVN
ncbi:YhcH/YjgK/YiaL family protein [Lentisphaera profundi]|uniref:YhcH/YjgK/YiaL family protein n=1 Tax=Lentisphaera profundi TaxID=1658616 RepID=A0ABY7VXY3_9BACT|nr:YhcH/YjgK/YiaL family protein [Lentisphaera profundi]WDE99093.1 YhcH/YjgK/YiaL family protein [Lentisphaera profundi]